MNDETSLLDSFKLEYEQVEEESLIRRIRNWRARMKRREQKKERKRVHKSNTS